MSPPTVRFATEAPATADLVVIGGGIIGCATAFFAARAGLEVVVLERHAALGTLTTPVSTGAFRLQFDNAEEIEIVREGVELFDAFADRTGLDGWDLDLRHGGYLFCSLTDATAERSRRLVERQRGWGLTDVELLSGDEARARWPWLAPEVIAARYRANDGWLDVKRLTIGYATAASNAARIPDGAGTGGATFVTHAGVGEIVVEEGRVRGVTSSRGRVDAAAVVVAAGPFAAQVAALAGVQLELRPTRRQKLVMPDLPVVPADAPMTIEEETAAHWRPSMRGAIALFTDPETPAQRAARPGPGRAPSGHSGSSTHPRSTRWRGSLRSGVMSGPAAPRPSTGSSRPASTRSRRIGVRISVLSGPRGCTSTEATPATASWPGRVAADGSLTSSPASPTPQRTRCAPTE